MKLTDIFEDIKKSFCELTSYKIRGNVIEIITAYSTLNNKFVSVFIKLDNDKIVITDGGWIDSNYYETPEFEESDDISKRVINYFAASYNIKSTIDKIGIRYFYKTCNNINEVTSCVFDLSNFVVGAINSRCIQYKDEKEEKDRESFKRDANDFLAIKFSDSIRFRQPLDDVPNIKFNAIINKHSNLYLISYITGSTPYYFDNDLRRTIVNFEIAEKSKYRGQIKERLSIINNLSEGYQPNRSASILELLEEKITKPPINWSEKERILDYISN